MSKVFWFLLLFASVYNRAMAQLIPQIGYRSAFAEITMDTSEFKSQSVKDVSINCNGLKADLNPLALENVKTSNEPLNKKIHCHFFSRKPKSVKKSTFELINWNLLIAPTPDTLKVCEVWLARKNQAIKEVYYSNFIVDMGHFELLKHQLNRISNKLLKKMKSP